MENNTPAYIKNLLTPNAKKAGRKVWGVDLETIWIPFFTATNTMQETTIPLDALGQPIRLAYNKDGSVKFSGTGRVVTRVAKDLSSHVAMVRENFVANLSQYAEAVQSDHSSEYNKMATSAVKAGKPIADNDNKQLELSIQRQVELTLAEAEKTVTESPAETKAVKETVKV